MAIVGPAEDESKVGCRSQARSASEGPAADCKSQIAKCKFEICNYQFAIFNCRRQPNIHAFTEINAKLDNPRLYNGLSLHEVNMNRVRWFAILGFFVPALLALTLAGQERPGGKNKGKDKDADEAAKVRPLPSDERLLALHRDFVKRAETLAKEYEGDKDWGKARTVYEEILKLVPQYAPA